MDRYDDALEGEEQDELTDDQDAEEEEPELDERTSALLDKRLEAARAELAAENARAMAELKAQHDQALLDYGTRTKAPEQPQAAAQEPAEPEMPDPSYDPQGFGRWLVERDERMAKRIVSEIAPQFQQMQEFVSTSRTASQVTARAKEILGQYGASAWAEEPGFDERFEEAILTLPANQREQPQQLLALAAFVRGELGPPTQQQPRDQRGQFTAADRAAANRQALAATGPSQGTGRAAAAPVEPDEREMARMLGVSVEEWRGLGEAVPTGYRRARDKRSPR